jgi:hypothetical protein
MTKNICDGCKKQIIGRSVSIANSIFFKNKDFCQKCVKPAEEYLKTLFANLATEANSKK